MNQAQLLKNFDRIAEAPDAVSRLRRFILDLAVRGKLVEQDPNDEPASELLKRIQVETARLLKAGKIRKPKPSAPIQQDELPIEIPLGWVWIRLCDFGTLSGGMTPSKNQSDYWDGDIVWLSPKDIKTDEVTDSELKITAKGLSETRLELFPTGSLFMVARSGILKRIFPVAINRVPAASNQDLKVFVPYLKGTERYLQIMFRGLTDFILHDLVKTGTTVQSLKYAQFETQPFPLPPLAEQHRIVAKVDELMALCDRLGTAQKKREERRDRLNAASLNRINQPAADGEAATSFREHARFHVDHLPRLTTRPEHIKSLRQTILDLAVCGKLVDQEAADEPAIEYLLSIAGLTSNRKDLLKPLTKSESGRRIPASWAWLPMGALIEKMDAGWSPQCENHPRASDEEWAVLKTTAVQSLKFDASQHKKLPEKLQPRPQYEAQIGDILVTRAGPKSRVGVSCVVDVACPRLMISDKLIRFHALGDLSPRYIALTLNAGFTLQQIEAAKSGMAVMQMNISQNKLRAVPIPLPPIAEQHRIVAKVDELMAVCDQLEAQLNATQTDSRRLLEAVLQEALLPATETALTA